VYLRGLERWLADLLQPVFDGLVAARSVPRFVQRLKVVEFTLDHEAPVFSNMRRRTSRKVVFPLKWCSCRVSREQSIVIHQCGHASRVSML
jgi:hypothetical protein